MESLKTLFKIGLGPSSSHTIGPHRASEIFKERYSDADKFKVILYGSLGLTGEGHGTDKSILSVLENAEIIMDTKKTDLPHPNTMDFFAYKDGKEIGYLRALSIGGGSIEICGEDLKSEDVYPEKSFDEIMYKCKANNYRLCDYVKEYESEVYDYLRIVWRIMQDCVESGLAASGMLPGPLGISRKAKKLSEMHLDVENDAVTEDRVISSYAFAVAEENACGGTIVTAPTCGSAGVLPAVLYYMNHEKGFDEDRILDALATAGVIGNVLRTNGSVSGAEAGCQAEIGSACCMASAALAELYKLPLNQVEYAAEVAMEHHLGLTCDPVCGLVQIPCIERNAIAAMRAMNCVSIARFLSDTRKISFDAVVETMLRTGKDISPLYRETSEGGLAKLYE